ncbi:MAG: radical SAM protein [Candidatus Odinarchaeia archaeon]
MGVLNFKKILTLSQIAFKIIKIKFFNKKIPIFGSADITNSCNLKCKHCYWWLNNNPHRELTADEWRNIVRKEFVEKGVSAISLTGGEPLLRPDVIEAILDEVKWRNVSIVTNGTLPLIDFGVGYFVSIDGTENIHNMIRGAKVYKKIKQNIINHPEINVVINMTINRLNYKSIPKVVSEWYPIAKAITFQFHTPFSYDDRLWLPYGKERDTVIDMLLKIKEKLPDFIANTSKQLNLFRNGKWTKNCPTWFFVSLDSQGRKKQSCVISNTDKNGVKPVCERCGLACNAGAYAGLFLADMEWLRMFSVAKRAVPYKSEKLVSLPSY